MSTAYGTQTVRPGMVPVDAGRLYAVLKQVRESVRTTGADGASGMVVAFTSANKGEGVTHTIDSLVSGLSRFAEGRSLVVSSADVRGLGGKAAAVQGMCQQRSSSKDDGVYEMSGLGTTFVPLGDETAGFPKEVLETVRGLFDYVFVDCPALCVSSDVLCLAPLVDAVLVVVEADRTRRAQVVQAERSIALARGHLLGHVLNKRRYVVPEWVYRRI